MAQSEIITRRFRVLIANRLLITARVEFIRKLARICVTQFMGPQSDVLINGGAKNSIYKVLLMKFL